MAYVGMFDKMASNGKRQKSVSFPKNIDKLWQYPSALSTDAISVRKWYEGDTVIPDDGQLHLL